MMQYHNLPSKSSQKGFSLIELMVVVGIAGLIIAGIIQWRGSAQEGARIDEAQNLLRQVQTAVDRTYRTSSNFEGLDNAVLTSGTILPDRLKNGDDVRTPWASDGLTVSAIDSDLRAQIALAEIPGESCVDLSTGMLDDFQEVQIGGTTVENPSDAASSCSDGDNTLNFIWQK